MSTDARASHNTLAELATWVWLKRDGYGRPDPRRQAWQATQANKADSAA